MSLEKIASLYGISDQSCRKRIVDLGGKIRNSHDVIYSYYTLNESVFENIDTVDKAYWLGFIKADGSIENSKDKSGRASYRLTVKLQERDFSHLKKLRIFLGTNKQIKPTTGFKNGRVHEAFYLRVGSKKVVLDLAKYGVVRNKTKKVKPFDCGKFARDYWRGLVDGDGGCGTSMKRHVEEPYVELYGNIHMVRGFKKWVCSFFKNKIKVRRDKGDTWVYRVSGKGAVKVMRVLYDGAETYLDRKKDAADRVFKMRKYRES